MEKKNLVINLGSSSKKCALYGEAELCGIHLEKTSTGFIGNFWQGADKKEIEVTDSDYNDAGIFLIKISGTDIADIAKIGIRVVAPGTFFQEDRLIDDTYVSKLTEAQTMAPLHIAPVLEELKKIKAWSGEIPLMGISDSAFYKSMPIEAKLYGLPKDVTEQNEIYRYGYHGISMASVLSTLQKSEGGIPEKIIICHLGSGSTITALKNGQPVDTSMGFTPLEGVPMGSRVGNIDASAVLYLLKKGMDANSLEEMFYKKSGLLGLSGQTPFVKELIDLEKSGDANATQALFVYARAVKKYIGAYSALLGGVDLIVFTATIGERSDYMRDKITSGLEYLNTKTLVVLTDEMSEIASRLKS
ncbi:MAG: acetate/propionate family kinase [Candidatus Pacebacteria bacterium]|nr:acetate/propionate family kinase [Candidatus Paceibacterota bacterium]